MISVIIPTLNEEKYLRKCLESICRQDCERNFEIIISDGYSTDQTVEIAKEYGAKIIQEKARGPARAKNLGSKLAEGDILLFTDADATFPKGFLNRVSEKYEDNEVVAVGGPLAADSRLMKHQWMYWLTTDVFPSLTAPLKFYHFQGSNMSLRASAFRKIGGFNESLKILEDNEISNRAAKVGRVIWDRGLKLLNNPRRFKKEGYSQRIWEFGIKGYFKIYMLRKNKIDYTYTKA